MEIVASLLRSKIFWIVVAIIILLIIINKNWPAIKDKLFERKIATYAKDDQGNVIKVSELDKPRIQKIVDEMRVASQTWDGLYYDDLKPLLDLTDQELDYAADIYKQSYGVSMYSTVEKAWMPATQADQELMARLDKLAKK